MALHVFPEHKKGELACLYVNPSHENHGIGKKLIQFVESKAKEMGLSELLTLSTQAFTYFQSKGGFSRRHARRFAARAPREIRAERQKFQGAGEEIEMKSGSRSPCQQFSSKTAFGLAFTATI